MITNHRFLYAAPISYKAKYTRYPIHFYKSEKVNIFSHILHPSFCQVTSYSAVTLPETVPAVSVYVSPLMISGLLKMMTA